MLSPLTGNQAGACLSGNKHLLTLPVQPESWPSQVPSLAAILILYIDWYSIETGEGTRGRRDRRQQTYPPPSGEHMACILRPCGTKQVTGSRGLCCEQSGCPAL